MSKSVGQINQNILVQINRPNRSEYTCLNTSAKSFRIYFSKSVGKIHQNIVINLFQICRKIGQILLVQIRRPNRSDYICPNPSAKSVKIYLSKSVGEIGQNILVQIHRPNRSEFTFPNLSAKFVRI